MFKKNMFFSLIAATCIVLSSCSGSKSTATASRDMIKGDWQLNQITYGGGNPGEKLKFTLLDEGDETCLSGSTWSLPNNGYGSYTINPQVTSCTPGERKIVWSYRLENGETIFQFKKLEPATAAKNITDGYKFKVISADNTSMELRSDVAYNGNTLSISYSFSRIKIDY